jgi:hypothetical protein
MVFILNIPSARSLLELWILSHSEAKLLFIGKLDDWHVRMSLAGHPGLGFASCD